MGNSPIREELVSTREAMNEADGDERRNHHWTFVSGFEKKGHFGPDLNFEILICTEIIRNQLSFTACFMFIAAWGHFL